MKRPSPPPNPTHTSPSTSSSSSSCVLDDHPTNDQPIKQSIKTRAKRARKRPAPQQCRQKGKQISSITTTINSDADKINTPNSGRRSSVYRGVTRHRWTGRFEAHLWDKSSYNSIQNKKGKQVYLGAYDCEDDAARTYDLAAIKYWGPDTILNFPSDSYTKELEEMQNVTKEEYLASLRRRSSGFSRGVSKYRGVAKHHHNGRWEARIGRVFGNKYLYLGTFSSQEEAAKAYDLAAIQYRGRNAVTNFDINNYVQKDEIIQQDENPTAQDVAIQQQHEEPNEEHEQAQQKSLAIDAFDESELANAFNESPVLEMNDPSCGSNGGANNDDPWSFNLQDDDGEGYNPMLLPHILQEDEEDGSLLDLLDPKAFEDDIHLMFDGYLEGMENGEEKTSFDSTSFSTVTCDLF